MSHGLTCLTYDLTKLTLNLTDKQNAEKNQKKNVQKKFWKLFINIILSNNDIVFYVLVKKKNFVIDYQ